jgi:hypothetical protein
MLQSRFKRSIVVQTQASQFWHVASSHPFPFANRLINLELLAAFRISSLSLPCQLARNSRMNAVNARLSSMAEQRLNQAVLADKPP